ncbi:MAG: hypothetical protein NC093_09540 [Alistipes sp.]|nr:hypothetical protein [Alistipes sp.]
MKKILVIFIISTLFLTACNGDLDKDSSSDIISAVVTEDRLDGSEKTGDQDSFAEKNTTAVNDSPTSAAATDHDEPFTKSHDDEVRENVFSDKTEQGELPIINEKDQGSDISVTTSVSASSKTEATTAAVNDDVIELPFVPVR